jgi:hypothetical protein
MIHTHPEMMRSELVLVWFQPELNPLLSLENEARVRALDWNSLAQDFEIS